ncbi:MAG: carboxymuconolactone decarboxylase family protein [Candidatus Competibacterales bacterium]|nr:carboxymuconolactone decarboxylase family protein [Candidatus Competibacterales bacterium]
MSADYQIELPARDKDSVDARGREVLDKAEAQVGFIPNMYACMVNSPGLLDTYLDGYQRFREESGFDPVEQEVVFLTISRENGCHYCMAAHSTIADKMSKVPTEVTDAIRDGREIPDPKLAALSRFTRTLVASRGLPKREDVDAFLDAGYRERAILEIVLAIAVKTLSNYANHLFHTPVDEMFAERRWNG